MLPAYVKMPKKIKYLLHVSKQIFIVTDTSTHQTGSPQKSSERESCDRKENGDKSTEKLQSQMKLQRANAECIELVVQMQYTQ